jgi:hypothetical protein
MNFSENLLTISSQKVDFLSALANILRAKQGKNITPERITTLMETVAKLEPLLFISAKELREGHSLWSISLEDLDRELIGNEIESRL